MLRSVLAIATAAVLTVAGSGFTARAGEWTAHPPHRIRSEATATYQSGFSPAQIRTAYGFAQLAGTGAGKTIALTVAYGSPTIQNDLAVFSQRFGLPAASLSIAYPQGKPNRTDSGWALETSLDVQWAHAIAPGAKLLLVVAKTNSISNLLGAVDYASQHGANVVSMSWGGSEFSSEANYNSHFSAAGISYVASSGDNGTGASWPAVSPGVVAVGGTTLTTQADGTYVAETAWSGSGGGISAYETEPAYQTGFQSTGRRTVPDVAFNADPNTGVAVYDSTAYSGQKGWWVVGGTSAGAPAWAGLFALTTQGGDAPLYSQAGTAYAADYHDVSSGTNGTCGSVCTATVGFDEVTGIGSPVAGALVVALGGS